MENVPPLPQVTVDNEHLKLLSIFHYIAAGLGALFGSIPLIHVALGIGLVIAGDHHGGKSDLPPAFIGWFFMLFGLVFVIVGWTHAVLLFLSARFIAARTHHTYCFVMGCIQCLFIPIGTILGIFTIIVLNRPSVKAQFHIAS